ncbi:hypothetical protein [Gordonia sp. (in: high G+C Gram-positive bacteria)]|uniref:hypothetical protein n=1 Tax=Gordonia sp. (in: high G+C Gram-positive bacteria) TaxID=84139 RepID=UPI0016B69B76|nr:hypothetical protein [Gordonia sp. (in: high G+C Gram-positive bacteria)]NLG47652.1 hypothetical protein [Gordonia sp. (in: high G+C Gram-positive bacteria)]
MHSADMDITPGTHVRCRLPSGDTADAVVSAIRRFPVDFIEVQLDRDGTKVPVPRSDIAQSILPIEHETSVQDVLDHQ